MNAESILTYRRTLRKSRILQNWLGREIDGKVHILVHWQHTVVKLGSRIINRKEKNPVKTRIPQIDQKSMLSIDSRKMMHHNKVFIHENNKKKRAIERGLCLIQRINQPIRPKFIVWSRKKPLSISLIFVFICFAPSGMAFYHRMMKQLKGNSIMEATDRKWISSYWHLQPTEEPKLCSEEYVALGNVYDFFWTKKYMCKGENLLVLASEIQICCTVTPPKHK